MAVIFDMYNNIYDIKKIIIQRSSIKNIDQYFLRLYYKVVLI